MLINEIVLILLGFTCLIAGADLLVKGGSGIARALGISPLVVGLTIVAYGTSMPEFMASFIATWKGISGIALGNVLGSNIFNIAVVLGIAAILKPIEIEKEVVLVQVPIMIGVTLLLVILGWIGNEFSRIDGAILFFGVILYTVFSFYRSRSSIEPVELEPNDRWARNKLLASSALVAGCVLLFLGGRWVVNGSSAIAIHYSIPASIIGCTIVAVGTSLPELVTTIIGILRKEHEIGVGNAIGSCIFNLLMVVGGSAMFQPIVSNWRDFKIELFFTFGTAILLFLFINNRRLLRRSNGVAFIISYLLFMFLVLWM